MSADNLRLCEEISLQAKQYMEDGEFAKSCKAYLEAADQMMKFAAGETGKRKTEAQSITELLLNKAREAKKATDSAAASHNEDQRKAEIKPIQSKPAVTEVTNNDQKGENNISAITRDLKSYQNNNKGKNESGNADKLKFVPVKSPNVHFSDIAGLETIKSIIQMKIIQPILHPDLYERFSKATNGGILLYGPPGTGKTMIARAIATETNLSFFSVRCSDIVGKGFGDGERNLKALFDAARTDGHAMIFFDEFESLACKRGSGSTVMNRIVPELLSQMDGFQKAEGTLIVLAATNRPWDLDSAVLRPPRMSERIYVGLPDKAARCYMVKKALDILPKAGMPDYDAISDALEGFNCADITAFIEKVKEAPIRRGLEQNDVDQFITLEDIEEALVTSHSSVQKADLEKFSSWEASQR